MAAEAVNAGAGEGLDAGALSNPPQEVPAWEAVNAAAAGAEKAEGQHGRRIVKVFSQDDKAPALWHGTFGNAPVEVGFAGFVFSDGEAVTL